MGIVFVESCVEPEQQQTKKGALYIPGQEILVNKTFPVPSLACASVLKWSLNANFHRFTAQSVCEGKEPGNEDEVQPNATFRKIKTWISKVYGLICCFRVVYATKI